MTAITPLVRRRALPALVRTTATSNLKSLFSTSSRRADVAAGTADITAVEDSQHTATQVLLVSHLPYSV